MRVSRSRALLRFHSSLSFSRSPSLDIYYYVLLHYVIIIACKIHKEFPTPCTLHVRAGMTDTTGQRDGAANLWWCDRSKAIRATEIKYSIFIMFAHRTPFPSSVSSFSLYFLHSACAPISPGFSSQKKMEEAFVRQTHFHSLTYSRSDIMQSNTKVFSSSV